MEAIVPAITITMKKTNLLSQFLCLLLFLSPVLSNPAANDQVSNATDPLSPKADAPYVPYGLLGHNSSYDEEQVGQNQAALEVVSI